MSSQFFSSFTYCCVDLSDGGVFVLGLDKAKNFSALLFNQDISDQLSHNERNSAKFSVHCNVSCQYEESLLSKPGAVVSGKEYR